MDLITLMSKEVMDTGICFCSSCRTLLTYPIFLVDRVGHVCYDCHSDKYLASNYIRNECMEIFLRHVIYTCKNKNFGCDLKLSYGNYLEHVELCEFRSIICRELYCDWTGLPVNFLNHFLNKHPQLLVKGEENLFLFKEQFCRTMNVVRLLVDDVLNTACFLKITCHEEPDKVGSRVTYSVYDAKNFYSENTYSIKHMTVGKDNNNIFSIDCKNSHLKYFNDPEETQSTITNRETLNQRLKLNNNDTSTTIVLAIKPNSTSEKFYKEDFECPVCNNLMRSPIYQCLTGHSICHLCRKKLKQCPVCKAGYGEGIRNFTLENITENLTQECKFSGNGCDTMLSGKELQKHEENCSFKPKTVNGGKLRRIGKVPH